MLLTVFVSIVTIVWQTAMKPSLMVKHRITRIWEETYCDIAVWLWRSKRVFFL